MDERADGGSQQMTVVDGKITACTENELYRYWLSRCWDDLYTFPEFRRGMEALGVIVNDESNLDT